MNWQEWYWLAMQHLVMKHQPSIARRLFDLGEFVREAVGLEEPEFDAEIYETYRTEPERLSAYCADLVHLLYAANSKLKIIEMEIFLAEMLGVPLQVLDYPSRMVTKRAIEKSLTRPRRCIWRSRVKQKEAPIEWPITLTPKQ